VTGNELRQFFLKFFEERDHRIIPSASLIPHGDPTLLLTSAGMAQFKPYFLGLEKPPHSKLTSCQKCFRTTDIGVVGDTQHLTFFEMLGNFSIGDYFKKEAIAWAWEFVTRFLKIPEERLWVTIFLDDDEAGNYWQQIGVPADRILRFGEEHNFWGPAGNSGPCGPCSELHYDLGKEVGCGRPDCGPNCECGRFCEIWNLVFTQYNQDINGKRTPLAKPNKDTRMGLERVAMVMQGKYSVYETDLFQPLVDLICHITDKSYGNNENDDRAIRVVAEHGRSIAFLISDGVLPSNEGRGYVLRRILRRASLFGRRLGLMKPFLGEVASLSVDGMGQIYPELLLNRGLISDIIRAEEQKFITTLEIGLGLVEGLIEEALAGGEKRLPGAQVFRLYDTYGFPHELTAELAREKGLTVDSAGFEAEMEKQREKARGSHKFANDGESGMENVRVEGMKFVGYDTAVSQSIVVGLSVNGQALEEVAEGDNIDIILDMTPFYGEMGGQTGDTGEINSNRGKVVVTGTTKGNADVTIHRGKVIKGTIAVGDQVEAKIDFVRRLDIARNHTSTHLLQAALRQILGSHASQRGSSVEADRFRFDFSQVAPVEIEELARIQRWVNDKIRQDLPVKTRNVSYDEAIAGGAIALFEEKYGDEVRVVEVGNPVVSMELCGGTHVESTGQIGLFLITGESSIGTGMCRIEAVTGRAAEALVEKRFSVLQSVAADIETSLENIPARMKAITGEIEKERKRSQLLEKELSQHLAELLLKQKIQVNGVTVLTGRVTSLTVPAMREMADVLRDRLGSVVLVLAAIYEGKPNFLAMVTADLVAKGLNAGEIVKQVARVTGGGGGGKAGMAQAGGKDVAKLDEALSLVKDIVANKFG
jgi:alanyl-tRNA synthetase